MDQGVIRALKAFYRTNVVRHQINYIDAGKTISNINILEAMYIFFKTQAMDQGVIRALTAFSGTNVVRLHIKYIDAGENISNINVVEAMRILVMS